VWTTCICDIFPHKSFKNFIAEISVVITDYCPRGSEARENILIQELDNNLVVIHFASNGFNLFRHIVYSHQDVLVPK